MSQAYTIAAHEIVIDYGDSKPRRIAVNSPRVALTWLLKNDDNKGYLYYFRRGTLDSARREMIYLALEAACTEEPDA